VFCPKCGVEDIKSSQFCRACGAELSGLRAALDTRPDTNPIAAGSAREEIGRALADKIRQSESAADLKLVISEILPVAERFLETPAEARLRRDQVELQGAQNSLRLARKGAVTSAVGFGAGLVFLVLGLASREEAWLVPFVPSVITFLIGVGMLLYALFFATFPAKPVPPARKDSKKESPALPWYARYPYRVPPSPEKKELGPGDPGDVPSVTEGTTRHL